MLKELKLSGIIFLIHYLSNSLFLYACHSLTARLIYIPLFLDSIVFGSVEKYVIYLLYVYIILHKTYSLPELVM